MGTRASFWEVVLKKWRGSIGLEKAKRGAKVGHRVLALDSVNKAWTVGRPSLWHVTLIFSYLTLLRPFLLGLDQRLAKGDHTHCDIGVNVIFLVRFGNKSAGQFVNTGRHHLEQLVCFGKRVLQYPYFLLEGVQTRHDNFNAPLFLAWNQLRKNCEKIHSRDDSSARVVSLSFLPDEKMATADRTHKVSNFFHIRALTHKLGPRGYLSFMVFGYHE